MTWGLSRDLLINSLQVKPQQSLKVKSLRPRQLYNKVSKEPKVKGVTHQQALP